jgi:hypothetical protein
LKASPTEWIMLKPEYWDSKDREDILEHSDKNKPKN